jgi:NAD(P)H-hydrate epimerase
MTRRPPVAVPFPAVPAAALPWLTAAQMREVDRIATEELGLGLPLMMENAGRNLADLAVQRFRPSSVVVLAGAGANGGGGIAAARHLANRGVSVRIVLARAVGSLARVTRAQLDLARRVGVGLPARPGPADLVIDALIGYGLVGDPRGRAAELIRWANEQGAPVLALDVPSGLDATTGREGRPSLRATATLTLAAPKAGLRRSPLAGELYVGDISVPPALYRALGFGAGPVFAAGPILRVTLRGGRRPGAPRPRPTT